MPEIRANERHIAMLIDGDNAQYQILEQMLEEVSRYGAATIRRAYGDWTQPNLANWRPAMLAHAIHPIQQWRYTNGKNATDSALIIEAMDILYSRNVQGFCIVSSDSDYTRLCTRIRESGLFVMGMGREHTPESFIKACEVFVFVENITPNDKEQPLPASDVRQKAEPKPAIKNETETPSASPPGQKKLIKLLRKAFDICAQDDGWAHLGEFGNGLHRLDPSFDSRTYGYKSLSLLVKSLPQYFVIKGAKKTGTSTIYIQMK